MIIDTNTPCLKKVQDLKKNKGVTAVGRYYRKYRHPEWAITQDEAREFADNGVKLFMVWEDFGHKQDLVLTRAQGKQDGLDALAQAQGPNGIGQPEKTPIYFAVEGLDQGYKTADLPAIRDYFAGVKDALGAKYSLGVYGDGVVCKTLRAEGICQYSWLAAASCSFEGTCDAFAKGLWTLAQLPPLELDWSGLSVDINHLNPTIASGDFGAFTPNVPVA